MILLIDGHPYHYEMENLCRVFFPEEPIRTVTEPQDGPFQVATALRRGDTQTQVCARLAWDGRTGHAQHAVSNSHPEYRDECERQMAVALFTVLSEATGYVPDWGILTGVRPSKLMNQLMEELGEQAAYDYFTKRLLVSGEKTRLAMAVARMEQPLFALSRPESFSLYLSIPFCPTRCSYCSFVSHSMATAKKLMPRYVELLCEELRRTGALARELGLRLETIYYGGGTPTTLSASQLLAVHAAIADAFDLSALREYTVEAGRPDTITAQRLDALREMGVTRISINPQTFEDDVLARIGRAHTAQCARDAFVLAREKGFSHINMDLIAGLPGDSPEGFARTLDQTLALAPEGVTVHTLALKRASALVTQGETPGGAAAQTARMLRLVQEKLPAAGYAPYYMYRQSRCVGNLENVGWSKRGCEGLYNVFMMEERHTVLAAGAGAVTKLKDAHSPHIERVFNFKYPYEYNSRFEELMARKARIKAFYEAYPY